MFINVSSVRLAWNTVDKNLYRTSKTFSAFYSCDAIILQVHLDVEIGYIFMVRNLYFGIYSVVENVKAVQISSQY